MVGFKYRHIVWRYKAAKNRLQLIIWPHQNCAFGEGLSSRLAGVAKGPGNGRARKLPAMWATWVDTVNHLAPAGNPPWVWKVWSPGAETFFSTGPMFGLKFDASNVAVTICDMVLHMGLSENGLSHIPNIFQWTILIFPIKKKKHFWVSPTFRQLNISAFRFWRRLRASRDLPKSLGATRSSNRGPRTYDQGRQGRSAEDLGSSENHPMIPMISMILETSWG